MDEKRQLPVISAEQVANYIVCPEAWRLKYLGIGRKVQAERVTEGTEFRREWVAKHDLSKKLRYYAKIVYLMVFTITVIVFLLEHKRAGSDSGPKNSKRSTESGTDTDEGVAESE